MILRNMDSIKHNEIDMDDYADIKFIRTISNQFANGLIKLSSNTSSNILAGSMVDLNIPHVSPYLILANNFNFSNKNVKIYNNIHHTSSLLALPMIIKPASDIFD